MTVRSDHDQSTVFVAAGDECKEHVGGVPVERDAADLVDDEQAWGRSVMRSATIEVLSWWTVMESKIECTSATRSIMTGFRDGSLLSARMQ
ncbi:hypothetical protein GCM10009655_19490 [Rhodoglobus aureus]|uniref:Uncharacterized protein n=1 Tax=Rhodoglobus aureus TaxID=191497 RepID=A0ABN1VQS3_9MICO